MHYLEALRFEPVLVEKVWGGRRLESVFGRKLPPLAPIGESWELSGLKDAPTYVLNGPYRGADLVRLVALSSAAEIFGEEVLESCRRSFPLLVKYIDASDVLSVQVHPDDELARAKGFPNGKSECWVVVHAEKGACVYRGFKEGVRPEDFSRALESGSREVEQCLNRVDVAELDVIDLPAGVVHAIGKGLLLCEIQQSSDLTYRVYDWGRVGLDGKPRPLHLAEAHEAMRFSPAGPAKAEARRQWEGPLQRAIYKDSYPFHLELASADGPARILMPHGRFEVVNLIKGSGELFGPSGRPEPVHAGDTLLLPAAWGEYELRPASPTIWVRSWAL